MAQARAKRILIPADAPERGTLERVLCDDGWELLTYGDAHDAEAALSAAPATVVVLRTSGGDSLVADVVKTVRRLCPGAFVVGMGPQAAEEAPDTVLRETCTAEEIATTARLGAAMGETREAAQALREQLAAIEDQARSQVQQIKELETANSDLRRWAASAQELAERDELTGLHNRRHFQQAVEREMERARRGHSCLAIAMLDIDHFKLVNDTYGHVGGDEVLRQFAHVLLKKLRRMDTVARWGGEEFVVLLPETRTAKGPEFDPVRMIERLRQAVEQGVSLKAGSKLGPKLTISAGVVQYPGDGQSVMELIAEVDSRLYRAKNAGRNRICAGT